MTTRLELRNIWKTYPDGAEVLRGLSFSINRGEIVLVVGENGAGKSTVLGVTAGSLRSDRGRILLAGRQIDRYPPERRRRLGIHRMHQSPAEFQTLSVLSNVLLSFDPAFFQRFALSFSGKRRQLMWETIQHRFEVLFQACPFLFDQRVEAGELSFGQKRIVEFLGVMSGLSPDGLLLLDEPFAGLQDDIAELMWSLVRRAAASGAAVLIVEHAPESLRFSGLRRLILQDGAAVQ